ncbi:response regulator receiver modulated metal dependent phosphohydrolase [Shewanella woodyi ATCC 51908]|uniref:Response regulator receiver modulated metal dependent phosphohydrolase n=2 Tax=Shewanella woodyi TaxID=60961 RepID=B1KPP9_SHEWM|nr:response regulator receiver modulated metal dependent phosphohydrolase [Shewanella woodyi ATCC 51908]
MDKSMVEKATVLVVDDTPENIDVLAGVLRDLYKVKVARNGEIALKITRSPSPPDLILLDVMMDGIDGYEVCRQLKEDHSTRHIPIIFVTAKIAQEDEVKGFELGAVDYISKPISPAIVLSRVKTHLALYNQNRELDRKVLEKTQEISDNQLKVVQRLGRAAEYKDNETGMHVIRMSHYTYVLALATGMSEKDAETLRVAAPMHDVGKIGIPDSILQKQGKLDEDEWQVMLTHAEIGAEILGDDSSEMLSIARTVALSHHEKWDGSGYPYGLKGEAIPMVGRIVAIADVFDALTSIRPYKQAWSVDEALGLLKEESGRHFDPSLVTLFIACIDDILEIKSKFQG